jgi:hypothetical protein
LSASSIAPGTGRSMQAPAACGFTKRFSHKGKRKSSIIYHSQTQTQEERARAPERAADSRQPRELPMLPCLRQAVKEASVGAIRLRASSSNSLWILNCGPCVRDTSARAHRMQLQERRPIHSRIRCRKAGCKARCGCALDRFEQPNLHGMSLHLGLRSKM